MLRLPDDWVWDSWIADDGDRYGPFSTSYVLGESPTGPWDVASARPFEGEPKLFAAPLVRQRDGTWAFVGSATRSPRASSRSRSSTRSR